MKTDTKILFMLSICLLTATSVFSMRLCMLTVDDLLRRDPYIIIANVDVNWRDGNGKTALHHAAMEGHADFITILLDRDADPQICDNEGMPPLFCAIIGKHFKCIDILTADKSYTNVIGAGGAIALHLAALQGYTQGVEILIRKGANINARDSNDRTPLYYAEFGKSHASTGNHAECITILLANDATL